MQIKEENIFTFFDSSNKIHLLKLTFADHPEFPESCKYTIKYQVRYNRKRVFTNSDLDLAKRKFMQYTSYLVVQLKLF